MCYAMAIAMDVRLRILFLLTFVIHSDLASEICKSTGLLQKHYGDLKFSETAAHKEGSFSYSSNLMTFRTNKAWCLVPSKKTPYFAEYATIDMAEIYQVNSFEVRGFRNRRSDKVLGRHMATSIRLLYSVDGKKKMYFGGREDWKTDGHKFKIDSPFDARFLYISMKAEGGQLTCIKIEVYGCKARVKTTTNKPSLTSTSRITWNTATRKSKTVHHRTVTAAPRHKTTTSTNRYSTYQPNTTTAPPPVIRTYTIRQGDKYSPLIHWVDTKYTVKQDENGILDKGRGCLIDGIGRRSDSNPFKDPSCWLGWKTCSDRSTFIGITLDQATYVYAIYLSSYLNITAGAVPLKRISIRTNSGNENRISTRSFCLTAGERNMTSSGFRNYNVILDQKYLNSFEMRFQDSSPWIFFRQIYLTEKKKVQGTGSDNQSEGDSLFLQCGTREGGRSGKGVPVIIVVVVMLVIVVVAVFFLYRYFWKENVRKRRRHRSLSKKTIAYDTIDGNTSQTHRTSDNVSGSAL